MDADLYRLKPLLAYFGNMPVSENDEMRVLQYQAHRRRLLRRPATVDSEVGTLKHVLKEGRKQGANPCTPEVERTRQVPRTVKSQQTRWCGSFSGFRLDYACYSHSWQRQDAAG